MSLELRVVEAGKADSDALSSLCEWLRLEAELRGAVEAPPPSLADGQMGAVSDVLVVAAGGGGAITVLVSSLKTWLAHPRRSDVRIEIRTPDGRDVVVTAERTARPEEIVREVLSDNSRR